LVRDIEVKINTASGLLDVSGNVEGLSYDRTTLMKAAPFEVALDNSDGYYDGKFARYNPVTIRVKKMPGSATWTDMFAGRLVNWENERPSKGGLKRITKLSGFDYFMDLQTVRHSGIFKNQTAGSIISNLLQTYCPDIDRMNIDAGPTLTYIGGQDKMVSDWIADILAQPECALWSFYILYKKAYFKDLSSAYCTFSLTDDNIGESTVREKEDLYANRIKVYGAKQQVHPPTLDDYTEGDAANWVGTNITLSNEANEKKVGSYSLKATHTKSTNRDFRRTFTSALNLNILKTLNFWIMQDTVQSAQIRLETDASNYYYRNTPMAEANKWEQKSFPVSADSTGWTATGSPNWANITAIRFYYPSTDTTTGTTRVDKLHLLGGPIVKVAEDWSGILQYGVREHEPIVDESITDPQFAEKLAQTWLGEVNATKNEIKCLQDEGDVDLSVLEEGKLVNVNIANEAISGGFVLLETQHKFIPHYGVQVTYVLGDPPSVYQLEIRNMMKEIDRLKKKGTDPDSSIDVWTSLYVAGPSPSGSLLSDDVEIISCFPEWPGGTFPYTFPFNFTDPACTLTITES